MDGSGDAPITPSNSFYVQDSNTVPGLGVSGIEQTYDGTGAVPVSGVASVRPGGDDPTDPYTGLIRSVGSLITPLVFTKNGSFEVVVVDRESDLPTRKYDIEKGKAYLTKENVFSGGSFLGSRLEIGQTDRQEQVGENLYYLQPYLTPALRSEKATIYSRLRGPFTLVGTEKLLLDVNGIDFTWDAAVLGAGVYTAEEIASSIDTLISALGRAYAFHDHIAIEAQNPNSGVVEIGLTPGGVVDLSGAAALGLLPGLEGRFFESFDLLVGGFGSDLRAWPQCGWK